MISVKIHVYVDEKDVDVGQNLTRVIGKEAEEFCNSIGMGMTWDSWVHRFEEKKKDDAVTQEH